MTYAPCADAARNCWDEAASHGLRSTARPAGRCDDIAVAIVVCAATIAVRLARGVAHDDIVQPRGIRGLRRINLRFAGKTKVI